MCNSRVKPLMVFYAILNAAVQGRHLSVPSIFPKFGVVNRGLGYPIKILNSQHFDTDARKQFLFPLWHDPLPSLIGGSPLSYLHPKNGHPFVAIVGPDQFKLQRREL